ncbi:unnamed protein product [Moneuplotes crassus]|uniref:Uncharacterized protein n=1 Tax=Euplotes crassus TaxID=5936 RepID=A0AAD1UNI4_EUPCR|nr:unnamed protein product [Moneuplotes crassus]
MNFHKPRTHSGKKVTNALKTLKNEIINDENQPSKTDCKIGSEKQIKEIKSRNKPLLDRFLTLSQECYGSSMDRMKVFCNVTSSNMNLRLPAEISRFNPTGDTWAQLKSSSSSKVENDSKFQHKLKKLIKNSGINKESYLNSQRMNLRPNCTLPHTSQYQKIYKPSNKYLMEIANGKKGLLNLNPMKKGRRSMDNLLAHRAGVINVNYKYGRCVSERNSMVLPNFSNYNKRFPFDQNHENKTIEKLPNNMKFEKNRNFQTINEGVVGVHLMQTINTMKDRYHKKIYFSTGSEDRKDNDRIVKKPMEKFFGQTYHNP